MHKVVDTTVFAQTSEVLILGFKNYKITKNNLKQQYICNLYKNTIRQTSQYDHVNSNVNSWRNHVLSLSIRPFFWLSSWPRVQSSTEPQTCWGLTFLWKGQGCLLKQILIWLGFCILVQTYLFIFSRRVKNKKWFSPTNCCNFLCKVCSPAEFDLLHIIRLKYQLEGTHRGMSEEIALSC